MKQNCSLSITRDFFIILTQDGRVIKIYKLPIELIEKIKEDIKEYKCERR